MTFEEAIIAIIEAIKEKEKYGQLDPQTIKRLDDILTIFKL